MISNWHAKNLKMLAEAPEPAATNIQRNDGGGIFDELIQTLSTESAFLVHVVQYIASWAVANMKEILKVLKTPFPAKAKKADLLSKLSWCNDY